MTILLIVLFLVGVPGGSESSYELGNDRSAVRLKPTDTLRFTMRMAGAFADPTMFIKLYQLDVRKGMRVAVINSTNMGFGGSKVKSGRGELTYRLQREDAVYLREHRHFYGQEFRSCGSLDRKVAGVGDT